MTIGTVWAGVEQRGQASTHRGGRQVKPGVQREYELLRTLHAASADVPRPFAHVGPVILMEFVGDEEAPPPLLKHGRLDRDEAVRLFGRILRNLEIFLACDWVHADLSRSTSCSGSGSSIGSSRSRIGLEGGGETTGQSDRASEAKLR